MKILVTGSNGFIAQHVSSLLATDSAYTVLATSRGPSLLHEVNFKQLDIREGGEVDKIVSAFQPEVIIHAAANGSADDCELHKDECDLITVNATKNIIEAASKLNSKVIFLSTDFVFSGAAGPYIESDVVSPVNYYGRSKVEGERIISESNTENCIVRLCSVYGKGITGSARGIITLTKERLSKGLSLNVVADQIRTPTLVNDIAVAIRAIIDKNVSGIYHISGEEIKTPYEMAIAAARYFNLDEQLVIKTDSASLNEPAKRPLKTGFNIEKAKADLGFIPSRFEEGLKYF
ncbi:MAG: SDR family oxidoreductase [Ginsengibacter sp.]